MANPVRQVEFPNEIPVDPDKETRAIFVHADQGLFASPSMVESFRKVDDSYAVNRAARFNFMSRSILVAGRAGVYFDRSFVYSEHDANTRDLLLVLSPLNDGRPESSEGSIVDFVHKSSVGRSDINKAKPNSWRPVAKLDVDYEFGRVEGLGMPRYQIYAREAPAMTRQQRRRVADGDMTPFGELALIAVNEADRIRNQEYGDGGFDNIHVFAAGMGAKALGAATTIAALTEKNLASVTLMNFALGEQSLARMGRNYAGRRMIGEASELVLPAGYVRVPELSVLRELDKAGPELAMRLRQAKALSNLRMVHSIMSAKRGVSYIEQLLDIGTTVTIANGHNESLVAQTDHYLPIGEGALHRTDIVGVDGKKVGQLVNEHGAALALVSNLGIRNYLKNKSS